MAKTSYLEKVRLVTLGPKVAALKKKRRKVFNQAASEIFALETGGTREVIRRTAAQTENDSTASEVAKLVNKDVRDKQRAIARRARRTLLGMK